MTTRASFDHLSTRERSSQVADGLHSAAIHLLRSVRAVDRESGLTPERLSLLSVVVFAGPRTVGELADAEGISAPAVSRMLNALEEEALVRRERDKVDRRVVRVVPTARGTRVMDRARRRRVDRIAEGLAELDPLDVSTLEEAAPILERVGRALAGRSSSGYPGRRSDG